MESKAIEKEVKIKTRKESSHSSTSTSSSISIEEEKKENQIIEKGKIETEIEIEYSKLKSSSKDKFELFLSEIEEVKTQKENEFCCSSKKSENNLIQDENRSIEEIIFSKGFKCEQHFVKTEDGYILTLFRIPGGKNCEDGSKLPPVLLQHGIFDSSDGWVCNGEDHSIAFVLAKNNFDVWLSNSRGNKYCKIHEKLKNDSFEFWQFSFHDLGLYDIPAVIKYIRDVNKSGEKIIYFGHSQGATLMLSGMAENYDFFKKNIKLFVALAPVARLNHLGSTLLNILSNISIPKLMQISEKYEICPESEGTSNCISFMNKNANRLTNFFIGLISDTNSKEYNDQNSLSVYFKHYPCGTSLKCLMHFAQIIKAKKFLHFDYKDDANYVIYHQKNPPEYDLSVIRDLPIMLITGEKDKLANSDDVRWLYNELKNNVIYFNIVPDMGHLSFLCGKNFSWFKEPLEYILEEFVPQSDN